MKKLLLVGLLIMTSGCSRISEILNNDPTKEPVVTEQDTSEKTVVCKNDKGASATFNAKGDEIHSMKTVSYITYEELGIDPEVMNKDAIQERINQAITDKYQGLAGVSIIGQMTDDKIEVTTEINFDQADMQALIDAQLIEKGEREDRYLSLKKTQETYAQSYTCE